MQTPNASDDSSWWDDLIAGLSQKEVAPPPAPQPPPVNQSAWEKSVEQAKISDSLGTVHDLGLIIFNETRSYSDRPDSNESIAAAREKMAWVIMNGDKKWGFDRQKHASTASPIEPSDQALRDSATRTAYQSSMKAARETYLGWKDSTDGALHLNARVDPGQYNWKPRGMTGTGKRIKTHSGPYNNSYTRGDTPSSVAYALIPIRTKQRPANLLLQNDILRGFDAAELHFPATLRRKRANLEISKDAMAVD